MKVSFEQSKKIAKLLKLNFDPKEFHIGINVELEHRDITKGNLVKTAKIAAAHLRENPRYYSLLKKYVE